MEVEAEDDDNEEIEEEEESDVVENARPLCVQCRDAYRMSFEEADALLLCRRDACLFCTDCNYHELLEDDRSFLMENALGKKLDRVGIYYARPANTDRELAFHAANYAEEKMKREGVHGWSISVWQRWAEPVDNTVENKFPASVMLGHCIAPYTPSPMHQGKYKIKKDGKFFSQLRERRNVVRGEGGGRVVVFCDVFFVVVVSAVAKFIIFVLVAFKGGVLFITTDAIIAEVIRAAILLVLVLPLMHFHGVVGRGMFFATALGVRRRGKICGSGPLEHPQDFLDL